MVVSYRMRGIRKDMESGGMGAMERECGLNLMRVEKEVISGMR